MKGRERRERVRLMPVSTTFVVVRPEFARLGRLLDINIDGLCFQYMEREEIPAQKDLPEFEVDMFINNNGFYVQGISCQRVYDEEMKNVGILTADIKIRRCGVRFVNLSQRLVEKIELYLKKYVSMKESKKVSVKGNRNEREC